MAIFDFPPNWRAAVTETHEYLTDIMLSGNRTEQRRALRGKPRGFLSYEALLHGPDSARFEWMMFAGQPQEFELPVWPWGLNLLATANHGTKTIHIEGPLPAWFQLGYKLAFYQPGRPAMSLVATSVTTQADGSLLVGLESGVVGKWGAGSPVFPVWIARVDDTFSTTRKVSSVTETPVSFKRKVSNKPEPIKAAAPDLMVGQMEALVRRVNWGSGMKLDLTWETELLDATIGPTSFEVPSDMPRRTRTGTVLCTRLEDINWWYAFFDRMKGRRGVFLAPSWQQDLPLQPPSGAGYSFEVPGVTFGEMFRVNKMLTHIFVVKRDGSYGFYRIKTVTPDYAGGFTKVYTDAWNEPYPPSAASMACLAGPCRLGVDSLVISWRTNRVAELNIATMTVEEDW
ncbi:hypothetical protein AVP3_0026 [Aeromonas phage AVP3]